MAQIQRYDNAPPVYAVDEALDNIIAANQPFTQLEGRGEVMAFLEKHQNLLPILEELLPILHQVYPTGVFTLEVTNDPEYPHQELTVIINPKNMTPTEAVDVFDDFLTDWWIEASKDVDEYFGLALF